MSQSRWSWGAPLVVVLLLVSCAPEPDRLVEVGRWVDESMPALFVVYHMKDDLGETELRELLKPVARELSATYPFVTQVTVHDESWATRLTTDELRRRIMNNDLPIGSDLVLGDAMTVQGGLVYTYYKNGDYDEFIYHARSPAEASP